MSYLKVKWKVLIWQIISREKMDHSVEQNTTNTLGALLEIDKIEEA